MNTALAGSELPASDPPRRARRRLGLRTRLALAFGILAGLLCVALSFFVGEVARDVAQAQAARYLGRLALEYRHRLDDMLGERLADLVLLARMERAPRELRERIDELVRVRGFTWIGVLDASNLSSRPWLRAGLDRTAAAGVNQDFIDLAVPLPAERGWIVGQVDLGSTRTLRAAIEASADRALPVELMLVAGDGTVLSGPAGLEGARLHLAAFAAAEPGAWLQRWPDRERYLVATSGARPQAPVAWSVLARTRADAALSSAAVLQRAVLWAGLILALAGIVVGWTLATRHARPLETLTRAAQEIASGNDRTQLPPLDDNHEVARLAEALRAMLARLRAQAESLRDAQGRLQQRVHERTAELVKAQARLELEIAEAATARDELARAHEQLALALEASSEMSLQEFAKLLRGAEAPGASAHRY